MKSKRRFVEIIVVCAIVCLDLPSTLYKANSLCETYDSLNILRGEYRINNNIWGSTPRSQCITAYPKFDILQCDHLHAQHARLRAGLSFHFEELSLEILHNRQRFANIGK